MTGTTLFSLLIFALGLTIGSFLNVCIFRLPQGQSIVWPHSYCPFCRASLRWYHNIPVASFVFLRARCSFCGQPISLRYPLVELITGLLFLLVFLRFGFQWATPVYWLFFSILVTISFIDLDHRIIPDVISLPGVGAGFLLSFLIPWLSWVDSLLGVLIGGGLLYAVAVAYKLLRKVDGMGGGDIKLLAMIGAFLGWKAVFPVIFISSAVGCLIGIPLMLFRGGDPQLALPFGPFLALGALVYLLYGRILIQWYVDCFL